MLKGRTPVLKGRTYVERQNTYVERQNRHHKYLSRTDDAILKLSLSLIEAYCLIPIPPNPLLSSQSRLWLLFVPKVRLMLKIIKHRDIERLVRPPRQHHTVKADKGRVKSHDAPAALRRIDHRRAGHNLSLLNSVKSSNIVGC